MKVLGNISEKTEFKSNELFKPQPQFQEMTKTIRDFNSRGIAREKLMFSSEYYLFSQRRESS